MRVEALKLSMVDEHGISTTVFVLPGKHLLRPAYKSVSSPRRKCRSTSLANSVKPGGLNVAELIET